jgi:hypothetical protein
MINNPTLTRRKLVRKNKKHGGSRSERNKKRDRVWTSKGDERD